MLLLRFAEDLSVAQTAELLGVSEGTVKKLTHVAKERVRSLAPDLEELV